MTNNKLGSFSIFKMWTEKAFLTLKRFLDLNVRTASDDDGFGFSHFKLFSPFCLQTLLEAFKSYFFLLLLLQPSMQTRKNKNMLRPSASDNTHCKRHKWAKKRKINVCRKKWGLISFFLFSNFSCPHFITGKII